MNLPAAGSPASDSPTPDSPTVGSGADAPECATEQTPSATVSTHQPSGEHDSMSLLSSLLFDPLNYGYSATLEQVRPSTKYEKALVFVLATFLAAGVTVAVKFLVSQRAQNEATYQQLLDRVRAEQARGDDLRDGIAQLEKETKELASQEVTFASVPQPLLAASHSAPVKGPGLKIVLRNGNPDLPDATVQDQDLRLILNELWRSEAEAIAINDIRIGPRTAVRTAGASVLVNFQPVAAPYEITAVGPTDKLARGVTSGNTGAYFADLYKDFGITLTVDPQQELQLPAMRVPKISLQSIQVVKEDKS